MKRKLDSSELIQEITDTLAHWSGTDLAEKASDILGHEVIYLGDLYEIIDDPVESFTAEDDTDQSEADLHDSDLQSEFLFPPESIYPEEP
jgi:hypothetical protein